MSSDFNFSPTFEVTEYMKSAFNRDGYIVVRGLLDQEELSKVRAVISSNPQFLDKSWSVSDDAGKHSKLVIWTHPGSDVTGMVARSQKVAGTCQELLGGEVYHYGSKIMMKNAETGGRFVWHQDYGYWYGNGCLRPDMMTVFIALDPCKKENGCLQVLRGTHRCGRVDHEFIGGQQGCDLERLENLKAHFDHLYAEMEQGDALFFHSNLLHASSANTSGMRRWAFLIAFNRADNDPVFVTAAPNYTPLALVPNESIKQCTNTSMKGKEFYDPDNDPMVKVTKSPATAKVSEDLK